MWNIKTTCIKDSLFFHTGIDIWRCEECFPTIWWRKKKTGSKKKSETNSSNAKVLKQWKTKATRHGRRQKMSASLQVCQWPVNWNIWLGVPLHHFWSYKLQMKWWAFLKSRCTLMPWNTSVLKLAWHGIIRIKGSFGNMDSSPHDGLIIDDFRK